MFILAGITSFIPQNRSFLFHFCCICLFLICSCNNNSKDEEPEFFKSIEKRIDTTDEAHKDTAIAFMDAAFKTAPHLTTADKIERFNVKTQNYFQYKKDYRKAFLYTDSTILLTENRLDNETFALYRVNALYTKGQIYYALKNYDECLHYYVLSKQTGIEWLKDDCSYMASSGIADLLFQQGKYLLAAQHYLENFRIEEKCRKDPFLKFVYMQGNLNSTGLSYYSAGLLDSAHVYFDSALHFIAREEIKFPEKKLYIKLAKSVVYYGQAGTMFKAKQFTDAEALYLKSIEGTKDDYVVFTENTQFNLVTLYLEINELQKADQLLQKLKNSPSVINDEAAIRNLYKLQASYYSKKKEKDIAYDYLQKYFIVRDSIDETAKKFTSMDVSREFENREQKAINQSLKNENEAKSFQLTSALLLSALAIAVILLVWNNLKRSARHVKELKKLNREIILKNDDLRTAFVSLEQSQAENTRITRTIAHDLKNPIGGIHSLVHASLRKEQTGDMKEMLELIKNACLNSITLINDLLAEQNTLENVRKEIVDMERLLKYCVELLQPKASEKNQQLQLQTDAVMISINRQKMWRVISNIIQNAIKFSPEHATINVKLEHKEEKVLLTVEDHGIGIPSELKDKIFTLDPEASRTGTAGEESHGLGLSISRKIIEEHNGKLWFESEAGNGCTFYMELPYAN